MSGQSFVIVVVPRLGERGRVQLVASDAGRDTTVTGSPKRTPSTKEDRPVTELALAKVHRIVPVSARRNVKLAGGKRQDVSLLSHSCKKGVAPTSGIPAREKYDEPIEFLDPSYRKL